MIVIAADILVAEQLVAELAASRIEATAAGDPDALKAAARQPIVMVTGCHSETATATEVSKSDGSMRSAARENGGDTFEVALADLQDRPESIMRHLILFASANLLAAEPAAAE